jgi:hypothetical protein
MTQTTDINPAMVEPLHGVEDQAKYEALVASMTARGWVGPPVVVVEREEAIPLAITGSHRLAAAEFVDIEAPTVEFRALFEAAGIDYDTTIGEYLEGGFDLYDAIVRVADKLPADITDHYGLDAH